MTGASTSGIVPAMGYLHGHGAFAAPLDKPEERVVPAAERVSVRVNRVAAGVFGPSYRFWWYDVHQVEGAG
jgi:hypothetical protein